MSERPPVKRCAVYTRKSVEDGLEQEFNSLDAQRESAENYIASQRANGWICLPERYDDGGFSGGNMDRPALKKLLEDVDSGLIDIIIVYKIDRLPRSLADFADLGTHLDVAGVSLMHFLLENSIVYSDRIELEIKTAILYPATASNQTTGTNPPNRSPAQRNARSRRRTAV